MKNLRILAIVISCSCFSYLLLAASKKKNTSEGSPAATEQKSQQEEDPVITEECQRDISIMHENVKNKQFADAYAPWKSVYNTCPNANKVIYTDGAKIIEWMFEKAKTQKEKDELANLSLELCDKRIKYFGTDPKYPKAYILGEKGLEYCQYFIKDSVKSKAYPWLKESVKGMRAKSKISVISKFMEVSYAMYKHNPEKYRNQYIADYTLSSDIFSEMMSNKANVESAATYKEYIDNIFAQSGAASCEKLDELYKKLVSDSKEDVEKLTKIIRLYRKVDCTESDVYFMASEFVHKKNPSAESAVGCAKMCIKKEDWEGALNYYLEALNLLGDTEDEDKADYNYMVAYLYSDKMRKSEMAKNYLTKAISIDPNVGRYYILLGLCYTNAKPYTEKDGSAAKCAILNKTVFWAAVDKFIKAKSVDASCAEDANKLIATYSKYFPTKEEIFDLPNELGKEGQTFRVGGWVNETTTCRAAK